ERTPVTGDMQYDRLEQGLTQIFRLHDEGLKGAEELKAAQQMLLAGSNAAVGDLRGMQARQGQMQQQLDARREQFRTSLLLSEGISEDDAQKFMSAYQDVFGEGDFYSKTPSFEAAYLDECQKEKTAGQIDPDRA